jgi:mono/diheme cytochrome c family protein
MSASGRRVLRYIVLALLGLLLVAQLVPYGRNHTNPPVAAEPNWDSAATRELAKRACFDCHSNETRWPWYSHVAPSSWLLQADVDKGREVLNFSEWNREFAEAGESSETIREGEMPPYYYVWLHPDARLSDAEKRQLAAGLDTSLAPVHASRARE